MTDSPNDKRDDQPAQPNEPAPLPVGALTWAAMLGRWVDFAKSALALPADDQGNRLRQSVADIIMLQAVWFSLKQIDELADQERRLGLDRAEVLIDKHASAIRARFNDAKLPAQIGDLVADAESQLEIARSQLAENDSQTDSDAGNHQPG